MKVLIFGVNGQDGYYLSEVCRKKGMEVIGISRSQGDWTQGDVSSKECVERLVQKYLPEMIFHLAARSTTHHDAIYENHSTIGLGTLNILESVKKFSPKSKVFITGSGLQFVNNRMPISEKDVFDHGSSYVTVRNYSVFLARYFRSLGIQTYVGYLFHHESPLRGADHVSQIIIQAAKKAADGNKEILELGDISVRKEWVFAKDIAEGIFTLMAQNTIFEATIGSGKAYSIEDWIVECFQIINKDWKEYIQVKENFKPEYNILVSNPETINQLGWKATTTISQLAEIMMQ